ncbi:unnamed protein product, partial [Bubo scandiacus]
GSLAVIANANPSQVCAGGPALFQAPQMWLPCRQAQLLVTLLRSHWLPPCHWCLPSAGLPVRPVPLTCLCTAAAASRSICTVAQCVRQQLVLILCVLPKHSWGDGTCCPGALVTEAMEPAGACAALAHLWCCSLPRAPK